MLKIGKLYNVKNVYLLLYPDIPSTKYGAAAAICGPSLGSAGDHIEATIQQEYWSRKLNKTVGCVEPGVVFLVLGEEENGSIQVLVLEQVGWIIPIKWMKFEELL